jgi:hypothetical protein
MESRSSVLFVVLLLLAGTAGVILAAENQVAQRRQAHDEAFQRLVGGLGFGPALDLSDCDFCFDPRLDDSHAAEDGPIPGGACFHPRQAASLSFYSPPEHGLPLPGPEGGDAHPH